MPKKNKLKLALLTTMLCIFGVLTTTAPSYANGWLGTGGGSTGGMSGGGGTTTACDSDLKGWQNLDCNGISWVYFEYVGGAENEGKDIYFSPGPRSGSKTISGECAYEGMGFWLLGYNFRYNEYNDPRTAGLLASSANYGYFGMTKESYGVTHDEHLSTSYHGQYSTNYKTIDRSRLKQSIKATQWGPDIYRAVKYGNNGSDTTVVKNAYNAARDYMNNYEGASWPEWTPANTYAFCAAANDSYDVNRYTTVTSKSAYTINGITEWSGDNGTLNKTVNVSSNSITINFKHQLSRSGDSTNTLSNFKSNIHNDYKNSDTSVTSNFGTGPITVTGNNSQLTVEMKEGDTITICESIAHPTGFTYSTMNKKVTANSDTARSSVCVTLTRPDNTPVAGCHANQNEAQIIARNLSNGDKYDTGMTSVSNLIDTVTSYGNIIDGSTIYAKPGDKIRFTHAICASVDAAIANYYANPNYQILPDICGWEGSGIIRKPIYCRGVWDVIGDDIFPSFFKSYTALGSSKKLFGNDFTSDPYTWTVGSNYAQVKKSPSYGNYVVQYGDAGGKFKQDIDFNANYFVPDPLLSPNILTLGPQHLTATIKIPYNYRTHARTTNSDLKNIKYILAGGTIDVQMQISSIERKNTRVSNTAYATQTKESTVHIFTFTSGPDTNLRDIETQIHTDFLAISGKCISKNAEGRCTGGYLTTTAPGNSRGKTIIKRENNVEISPDSPKNYTVKLSAPATAKMGEKICISTSIYPADSHGYYTADNIGDLLHSAYWPHAQIDDEGTLIIDEWYSAPLTCFTVAKKPNFNVLGGTTYADGDINTTTSTRTFNGTSSVFGSWTQYALQLRGQNKGFSSGATYWGGASTLTSGVRRACVFSSMTLANNQCEENKIGGVGTNGNTASSAQDVIHNIESRYVPATVANKVDSGTTINWKGSCDYDEFSSTYKLNGAGSTPHYNCLENGAKYSYSDGTVYIDGNGSHNYFFNNLVGQANNNTYVVKAKKIVVRGNFWYGDSASGSHDSTILSNITDVPQLILIADEIDIAKNVTNLDGWVIADKVNTCTTADGAAIATADIGSNCDTPLAINGPVLTKYLSLNRTAGSEGSTAAAVSDTAETINLGAYTQFWLSRQSEPYQQAVTTYQRDMAPRY